MFINTPKALDSGHGIDLFNVGLIFVERSIVNSLVNPKGPSSLKWDTFTVWKFKNFPATQNLCEINVGRS